METKTTDVDSIEEVQKAVTEDIWTHKVGAMHDTTQDIISLRNS